MMQFELLMVTGIIIAGALLRRRHVVEALWIVFWAHMSLSSVRHVPVFVTVCAPIIATEVAAWWTAWTAKDKKSSLVGIVNQMAADSLAGFRRTSILPWAVAAALIAIGSPIKWPQDFPSQLFPTKMYHDNAELIARSRVLTTDQWGDYLIYQNPQQKVFVDGRSDFYGETVGKQYIQVIHGHWRWREWMTKYDFDLALIPTETAAAALLKQEPGWRTLTDDGKQILLVRDRQLVPVAGNPPTQPRF
jgi:hypothetical protein